MKKNYSTTIHLPVVSVVAETVVATPSSFIVNWEDFHIVALWVKVGFVKKKLLLWQDILELSNGWYVQDEDDLSEPDEIVRIQEHVEKYFNLKGALCQTETGIVLGKVSDFMFDVTTGQITNIMIINHQLRVMAPELMLPISQVIRVENEVIIMHDLDKPIEIKNTVQEIILPAVNYV